ncbi:F-box protein At3g12350-like [Henckelia pumila]|uniref:F-box protein At3g12350-like n=1 Tax=Henckelia pumila TaxID=405737 RepID=UPI003C6E7039
MEPNPPFSFSDFPEDVQLCILSYLHQSDLEEFARTSKKSFALCNDDERLWFLKCTRRWGSQTRIQRWGGGGGGKISYKNLFRFLDQHECLIGFWRSDHEARSSPPLVLFEWGSFYIVGYHILPPKRGGCGLSKKPFLWITASSNGKALNYLDMNGTLSLSDKDLFRQDSEKLRATELIVADIDLHGNGYLLISENPRFLAFRQRLSTGNDMAEFEEVYRSPPDGLMAQIYRTLAKKVKVTGTTTSKKEMKRIRKREKEKLRLSVLPWESEHFEKIIDCSPSPSRPLQGLWKGIGANRRLNLYLVSYHEEWEEISCEIVGSFFSTDPSPFRGMVISASITAFLESPFSYEEMNMYKSRSHLCSPARSDPASSDVLRIFYADSGLGPLVPNLSENPEDGDGRVWLYADGSFGFGFRRHDYILDLEPMVKNGHFLDTYILL